jgi:predicted transcriptional regulator
MNGIVFDTSQTGFHAVLRGWQLKTLQVVWNNSKGINSRMVWQKVNQVLEGETISRASVINFLEDMREMGVLTGEEKTGKGGHHWVYSPAVDEEGFKMFIVKKMIASLMESFPEETKEVLKNLVNEGS